MKKLSTGGFEKDESPINWYYQFKKPETPHEKVKVLKKGQKITGEYLHTFAGEAGMFVNHLIKSDTEGKITIKGCTSLNRALSQLSRGDKVEIVYLGTGEAQKGRRAPYLFDVFGEPSNNGKATSPDKLKGSKSKAVVETDLAEAEEEVDADDTF